MLKLGLSKQRLLTTSTRAYTQVLTKDTISQNIIKTEYAVRGAIPLRGEEIGNELRSGVKYPFKETASLNIGNPQQCG